MYKTKGLTKNVLNEWSEQMEGTPFPTASDLIQTKMCEPKGLMKIVLNEWSEQREGTPFPTASD